MFWLAGTNAAAAHYYCTPWLKGNIPSVSAQAPILARRLSAGRNFAVIC